jgi:hypothetical protein
MSNDQFITVDASMISDGFAALQASPNLLFKTATDFSHYIEMLAMTEERPVVEVILEYCDDHDIDPDAIAKLIGPSLKGKIEVEMIASGLLEERTTLDRF